MGNDTPISALSDKPKLLYTYFKQNFAQVTNPPIDPIREELVMSLVSFIGPRPNLFDLEGLSRTKRLEVRQPILTNEDLEKIRAIGDMDDNHFKSLDARHHLAGRARRGGPGAARSTRCARRPSRRCATASTSSSCPTAWSAPTASPIPSLLATAGGAPSPDPPGPAHLGRPGRRDRRAARGASFLRASPATAPRRSTPISPSRR